MPRKSYTKYKDSGIKWIGKIPEHWDMKKLKYITKTKPSNIDKKNREGEEEVLLCNYVDVYKNEYIDSKLHFMKATATRDQLSKFVLKKGDVIVTKDSEDRNDIAVPTFVRENFNHVVCGYHLTHIKPKKILGNYLFRCFQSKWLQSYFTVSANGVTRYGINVDKFNSAFILIPTEEEQKAIADFLDKETSQVDSLIQKKEKQIELLKEKRSALITQAVTKGLNPNVKMKDSGIKWIGKIPEHWDMKKLKYITKTKPSNIDKKNREGEEEVLLCNYVDVYKNEYIDSKLHFMKATATRDQLSKFVLKKGDVIVTKDSEDRNDIAVPTFVRENFNHVVCGYHLTHIKPKKILGNYLFRCFQSKWLQSYFTVSANGVTRYGINVDKFNSAFILIPTEEEQKAIADFLDKETSQVDSLVEKIQKSIVLLKEYRSTLITSSVTGTIDVRKSQIENKNIIPLPKLKSIKPIKTKESELVAKANVKQVSQKTEIPLFKKTVLGAEIVAQLKDDPNFGRTKFMKTLYLCEAHLQIPLKGTYKREAAGPLDKSIYEMEAIMKKNKWFEAVQKGSMYKYKALKNSKNYKAYFDKYWGGYKEELNQLFSFVKKFTTEQLEIVDTIYAVWNDFLIEGKNPSDNEIVNEVKNNWHENKKRFSSEKLKKAIQWMKKNNLIPQGYGRKTKR